MAQSNGNPARSRRLFMVAVVFMFLGGLVGFASSAWNIRQAGDTVDQQRQYVDCQRDVNRQFRNNFIEQQNADTRVEAAFRQISLMGADVVRLLLDPSATQEQRIAAIRAWGDAQRNAANQFQEAENTRSEHPLDTGREC